MTRRQLITGLAGALLCARVPTIPEPTRGTLIWVDGPASVV